MSYGMRRNSTFAGPGAGRPSLEQDQPGLTRALVDAQLKRMGDDATSMPGSPQQPQRAEAAR